MPLFNDVSDINTQLRKSYITILSDFTNINPPEDDRYSGIFLPFVFPAYETSGIRVMLVGRETAGWNTKTQMNTLGLVIAHARANKLDDLVSEAVARYEKHLPRASNGRIKTTSQSRFKQFYFSLASSLETSPDALVYANLFAWDYAGRSPLIRPSDELNLVSDFSTRLLAAQIKIMRPQVVVFATGFRGIDPIIRRLFNEHFDGYVTHADSVPKKLWKFSVGDYLHCFRIAHPRATHGHGEYRKQILAEIGNEFTVPES